MGRGQEKHNIDHSKGVHTASYRPLQALSIPHYGRSVLRVSGRPAASQTRATGPSTLRCRPAAVDEACPL